MISRIGKYTVEPEPLGRGGFGVVYRAFDPDVKRPVAIKVLTEADPELVKRFQVEVGTTGNLGHKNIVTVYECGEQSGAPYLVMELLEGHTLEQAIKTHAPLSILEKVGVMAQVAEGLAFAHSKGVVHRDVKPGNIMLLPDGGVKIMDFGIARVQNRNTAVTREGFLVGTIPYMAPEQFEASSGADKQTDIFAYGDVLYELLTGKHPFLVNSDVYATIRRIQAIEPEPLCSVLPGCPEALELLVHRAIAKDRDVRYQSFDELLLDSEGILVDLRRERAVEIMAEVEPLIQRGELDAAEKKLSQVLELDPANREARTRRTRIREGTRQREIAKRASELLSKAESQLRDRQFDDAVQTLEAIARLKRTDPDIEGRLSAANARLEAFRNANRLVAEARRDQQAKQTESALKRLRLALDLDPEHSDAKHLLGRMEAELERRARDRTLQAIHAAQELFAEKKYDDALAALSDVRDVPEQAARVAELRATIEREQTEAIRKRRAEQFDVAVASARDALRARDMTKALHLLKFVSDQFMDQTGAPDLLSELRSQYEAQVRADAIAAAVQKIERHAGRREWREAVDAAQDAIRHFPEDGNLVRLRESIAARQRASELEAVFSHVSTLRSRQKFREALDAIAVARRRLGHETAIERLASEVEWDLGRQHLLDDCRRLVANGEFDAAVERLDGAREYREDAEVGNLLESARKSAKQQKEESDVASALQTARKTEELGYAEAALKTLDEALRFHPVNTDLLKAASDLRERIAEEQKRASIARHYEAIRSAIGESDWSAAKAALSAAQQLCGQEAEFRQLRDQVTRGQADTELHALQNAVQGKLAAGEIAAADRLIDAARATYSSDARWLRLRDEVAARSAFESALAQAARHLDRGDWDEAERQLDALAGSARNDDRPAALLARLRENRIAARVEEAEQAVRAGDFEPGIRILEALRITAPASSLDRVNAAYQAAILERNRDAERKRRAAEEARRKAEEEEKRRLAEETRRQAEERQRLLAVEEARKKAEETERRRIAEEARKQAEERQRFLAAEEARRKAEEEEKRRLAEEARKQAEERQRLLAAEKARRKAEEEETKRLAEEARKKAEDEQRLLAGEEARKKAEEAERRRAADLLLQAENERVQQAEEQAAHAQRELELERLEAARRLQEEADRHRALVAFAGADTSVLAIPPVAEPLPKPARFKSAIAAGVVIGVAIAAAIAGIFLFPSRRTIPLKKPLLTSLEIRTDPPGATVRVGPKSCTTPQCRIDLAPGNYTVVAELAGYQPAQQTVSVSKDQQPPAVELSLQPVHHDVQITQQTGTILVRAGVPGALVFVDSQPQGRTTERGEYQARVEAKAHDIRVQINGYRNAEPQRVIVASGALRTVTFKLIPEPATFELRGAPSGLEIRAGSVLLGTTGSTTFRAEIPAGDQVLHVKGASAPVERRLHFDSGQTLSIEWSAIAPPAKLVDKPVTSELSAAEIDARDWDRARAANDTASLETYLRVHPNGPNAKEAQARLDDLAWNGTNKESADSLNEFLRSHPQSSHRGDAQAQLAWVGVDRSSVEALQAFRARFPDSPHRAEAEARIQQIETQRRLAEQKAAEEKAAQEKALKDKDAQEQAQALLRAQVTAIQQTVDGFNSAFKAGKPRDVKHFFPKVLPAWLDAISYGELHSLTITGEPSVVGDKATAPCQLTVTSKKSAPQTAAVRVTFRRQGSLWIIESF